LHFLRGRGAHIHEELLDLELTLFPLLEVGRHGPDDAFHRTATAVNVESLAGELPGSPTAQGLQPEVSLGGDALDHEAHLVHVSGEHDARPVAGPLLLGNERAEAVAPGSGTVLQVTANDLGHRLLPSRRAGTGGEFLEKLQQMFHGSLRGNREYYYLDDGKMQRRNSTTGVRLVSFPIAPGSLTALP
jgi:hypothetical protein